MAMVEVEGKSPPTKGFPSVFFLFLFFLDLGKVKHADMKQHEVTLSWVSHRH